MESYLLLLAGAACILSGTVLFYRTFKTAMVGVIGILLLAAGVYLIMGFYNVPVPEALTNLEKSINDVWNTLMPIVSTIYHDALESQA